MSQGKKLNIINFFAILSLLASAVWSTTQVFASAPEGVNHAQAAQAEEPTSPAPKDSTGKPVDPSLTALDPQSKAGRADYVESQPQASVPMAYAYTYEWTGSAAIVDNSCSGTHQFVTLNVPDSFTLSDVSVGFNASHTWRDDVQAWVVSPTGTRITLLDGGQGSSDDNFDVLFKTGGSTTYTGNHNVTAPYYEYVWAPQSGNLDTLNGQAAQGDWQVEFCDDSSWISGTVNRWALFFNYTTAPDLHLSEKSATSLASPGGTINYVITVSNTGEQAASSATVVDPLPANVSFVSSATTGLTYNSGANQMEWSGSVPVGGQVDLQFTVQVTTTGIDCGSQIVNTATISDTALAAPVTVSAATEIRDNIHLLEGFDTDDGGFVVTNNSAVTTTVASWAWGVPTSGPGVAHSPTKVWATNLAGNYNNSEVSLLTSPAINLSAASPTPDVAPLYLKWWQWLYTESNYDYASIQVRGGATDWTTVYGPLSGAIDQTWTLHALDITDFAGTSDFQVRFVFTSDGSAGYPGWYIDDASIVQCRPELGLYLSPGTVEAAGCNGTPETFTFNLFNATGSAGTFDLSYTLDSVYGDFSGPASLTLNDMAGGSFDVTLSPKVCLPENVAVNGSLAATGNSYSDTAVITKTITTKGQWALKAPMNPGGLYDHTVVDGGNGSLYALGGNGQGTRLNLRYDTAANTWQQMAAVPTDLRIIDGGQVNGVIYLPGGYNGSTFVATTHGYDVTSNTWITVTNAPRPVAGYGVAACGGLLYRAGGAAYDAFPNGETGAEVYDPAADAWTALPPMNYGHTWPAMGCIADKLYVAGGIDANGGDSTSTEVYDITAGTWSDTAMAELPVTRWGSADFVLDGKLYMAGGVADSESSASVIVYSPDSDTWQEVTPLSQARFRLEGDSAYATGGMEPVWTEHPVNEKFVVCPSCDQNGTLSGSVFDYDGTNPPATAAVVTIQPGNYQASVDASGHYAIALPPFTYQVVASAASYPQVDGPYTLDILANAGTTQNFTLPRPDIEVEPLALSDMVVAPGSNSQSLQISNLGTLDLNYRITERPSAASRPANTAAKDAQQKRNAPAGGQIEVEPQLKAQMALDEKTGYLVYLRERPDLARAETMSWKERGEWVVAQLQATAERSQARVRAYLDSQKVEYKAYWVDNVIVVKGSNRAVFNGLQAYGEIQALRARRHPIFYEPESLGQVLDSAAALVQPNLTHVGADQVWAQGFTGQGIVVANIDTGVNYTHEALVQQYRGNLGGGVFDHNHNWYDPASGGTHLLEPADHDSHGSHTMGTMVGSTDPANPASATNTIGMAPGAKWIACRSFEAEDQELLDCAQFLAAPTEVDGVTDPQPSLRPHLINNSWGDCTTTYDTWYDGVLSNWHALGIYPIFSNGNASNCSYSEPPGLGTVGSPARAGNVTGVGATGRADGQYATFSNWGPTDQDDTINPLGYPKLKPQVVAPGTNRSASNTGNNYMDMSGTSMAAPHVAGLVALMWSAAPCLVGDYAQTETILQETAKPVPYASGGTPPPGPGNVPNYATGWGEIDASAAVNAAMNQCNTDWLPWVTTTPVTGTIGGGLNQAVQVDFTCTLTDTLQPQPLTGSLRILHNDPAEEPVDVDLQLYCTGVDPTPTWTKQVWINGQPTSQVAGPHSVRPGDRVVIVDHVGAAFDKNVSATLTETWGSALTLISYDTNGLGQATTSADQLVWSVTNVAPNATYPITKTFEVNYGDWTTDAVLESFQVDGEALHLADKTVNFVQYVPAVTLAKAGPAQADSLDVVPVTLTVTSNGSFFGNLVLTDTLPAGMVYQGGLSASHGAVSEANNTIHWSDSASNANVVAGGGFEEGKPNPYWDEASTNFSSPLCDASCSGPDAHAGDWYVWFGGIDDADETGSVEQTVTIPAGGKASLNFWLMMGVNAGTGSMRALLDGNELFKVTEADASSYGEYKQVTLNVGAYADGNAHVLRFESTTYEGGITNFFLDDVALEAGEPLPAVIEITFDAQVSGDAGDTIKNIAYLDWSTDHTSAMHALQIKTRGVDIVQPSSSLSAQPGSAVTHKFTVTNTGEAADTFDVTLGTHVWASQLSASTVSLEAGQSVTVTVVVTVPLGAAQGASDATSLTVTSQTDSAATDSAAITTTSFSPVIDRRTLYMPVITK